MKMTFRLVLALLTIATGLVVANAAYAGDKRIVHFAGFALSGHFDKAHEAFPFTEALIEDSAKGQVLDFSKLLTEKLKSQNFEAVEVTTDLGDYKRGDALALGFVLTWENVSTERFGDFTKIAVNLQAQALLFDFATKQIVSAYPFGVEYIDSVKGTPDRERILSDVKSLYEAQSSGLLDAFIATLHHIDPKTGFGGRLQIVSTDISQSASEELERNKIDPEYAKQVLANAFERYLSRNGNVPVLPHANDQAIGGVMAAQFVNADQFNFIIPKPDYEISITLDGLRKVQVSRTDAETAFAYASYLNVKIVQPLSETQFIDASFKFPAVKVIANSGLPDDSAAYQESLLAISDQITQQFKNPSSAWIAKWLVRQGKPDQLQKMPVLLDRCR